MKTHYFILHSNPKETLDNLLSFFKEMDKVNWGTVKEMPVYIYYNYDDFTYYVKDIVTITAEELLKNYSAYILSKFTPKAVTYCHDTKFICYYPELEKMLGKARCIVFGTPTSASYVYLKEPNLFSNRVFKIIGEYIAMQVNMKCLFWTEYKLQSDIPYLISSTQIERIFNVDDFNEWVSVYNQVVENGYTGCLSTHCYYEIAIQDGDDFDLTAQWAGNDKELNSLPLFVNIKQIEYERILDKEKVIERQMQVSLDNDYKIHIKCSLSRDMLKG